MDHQTSSVREVLPGESHATVEPTEMAAPNSETDALRPSSWGCGALWEAYSKRIPGAQKYVK